MTESAQSEAANKYLPAFLTVPPNPKLLMQVGALLWLGGGVLGHYLQTASTSPGILAALATEGLKAASFVGLICLIAGMFKRRKERCAERG